eukprot:Clim_evm10s236 gene=Clim_evmTU10s236
MDHFKEPRKSMSGWYSYVFVGLLTLGISIPVLFTFKPLAYTLIGVFFLLRVVQWFRFSGTDVPKQKLNYVSEYVKTRDGLSIHIRRIGKGKKKVAIAQGLGVALEAWYPVVVTLLEAGDYEIVSWDYRGLFGSEGPQRIRRLGMREHAMDLHDIKEALHFEAPWECVMGWSTGVQCALEYAAAFPEDVDKLMLMCGAPGHTLRYAFQPLITLPPAQFLIHEILDLFKWLVPTYEIGSYLLVGAGRLLVLAAGFLLAFLQGAPFFYYIVKLYTKDMFQHEEGHFVNYLRFFQELDAHSCRHLLHEIEHPALIITGLLDPLTPSWLSYEMHSRLKNSELIVYPLGDHFSIGLYPKQVSDNIYEFLEFGRRFTRKNSVSFVEHDPHWRRRSSQAGMAQYFEPIEAAKKDR